MTGYTYVNDEEKTEYAKKLVKEFESRPKEQSVNDFLRENAITAKEFNSWRKLIKAGKYLKKAVPDTETVKHWRKIIQSCEARPKEVSARRWLQDNNINETLYYRWKTKITNIDLEKAQKEDKKNENSLPIGDSVKKIEGKKEEKKSITRENVSGELDGIDDLHELIRTKPENDAATGSKPEALSQEELYTLIQQAEYEAKMSKYNDLEVQVGNNELVASQESAVPDMQQESSNKNKLSMVADNTELAAVIHKDNIIVEIYNSASYPLLKRLLTVMTKI